VLVLAAVTTIRSAQAAEKIQQGEMAGYLLVPSEKVP
jgi:hypothetical protein